MSSPSTTAHTVLLSLAFILSACGGGGGPDGYCQADFRGGSTGWGCTNCSGVDPLDDVDEFDRAIDGNSSSFQAFGLGPGGQIRITARRGEGAFEAAEQAGALLQFPTGIYNTIGVEFTAKRLGAVVASQGGEQHTAVAGNVENAGQPHYYAFSPQLAFDEIEALISVSGNTEQVNFRVYEFCGER